MMGYIHTIQNHDFQSFIMFILLKKHFSLSLSLRPCLSPIYIFFLKRGIHIQNILNWNLKLMLKSLLNIIPLGSQR